MALMSCKLPIMVANWKMYKTRSEALRFVAALKELLPAPKAQVWIAAPFTALSEMVEATRSSPFLVGAQNLHQLPEGPVTGEISAAMLQELGIHFVLIGHSERRDLFGEDELQLHLKVKEALSHQLLPLLCIGEKRGLREQLSTITSLPPAAVVIAYEPSSAIGGATAAAPDAVEEVRLRCYEEIAAAWGKEWAAATPILYGGAVTPEVSRTLSLQTQIDGVLVGRGSLHISQWIEIIQGFTR